MTMDAIIDALTSEDEIAHGEAYEPSHGGLGVCAYCDREWPCRTQRAIDRLLAVIASKAASTNPASIVVLGLTLDEVRRAVALADQYRPGWRSSQKPPSSPGE